MERLTERHSGVAVIKDKSKLKEAMEKLAAYEEAEEQKLQCEPGDKVWCIEECDDELELAGYLFMATCGEYVIVTSEYAFKSFGTQLAEMSEESLEYDGVSVMIFEKEAVFLTKEEAKAVIARMEGENG